MRHGISTTIVEIDPAVYDAARTWFGLPDPGAGKVYLEDARHWVEKRKDCSQSGQCPLFDTVIHDCFSGGGVPEHLFTIEFWKELKTVLDPEGVLVVVSGQSPNPSIMPYILSPELCWYCELGIYKVGSQHTPPSIRPMSRVPRFL